MPDPLKLEAKAWLDRAHDDLGAARKLLSGPDPFPATAAYHCQQAAEKALKALIASTGERIPKTHDLRVLVERCAMIDGSLSAICAACEELSPYATEFRYPTDTSDPTPDDAADAANLAAGIISAIAASIEQRFTE